MTEAGVDRKGKLTWPESIVIVEKGDYLFKEAFNYEPLAKVKRFWPAILFDLEPPPALAIGFLPSSFALAL